MDDTSQPQTPPQAEPETKEVAEARSHASKLAGASLLVILLIVAFLVLLAALFF